jgi:tetratricopeptide (TPR) repeat protein
VFRQKSFPYTLKALHETKFEQAFALHQKGMLEPAKALYEEVLRTTPDHVDSLHFLGVVEDHTGNHDRAIVLIEKAIEVGPDNPSCFLNLGNAQFHQRHWEAALNSYAKAIALKPDYAKAYVARANVLDKLGQSDAAIACLDAAISIDSDCVEAYYNRGFMLKRRGHLDAAIASYDQAVARAHGFAEAYLGRGDALVQKNELEGAIASFNKAISVRPDFALANWAKSLTLLLSGDFEGGWALHEWRWKIAKDDKDLRSYVKPLWLGNESLKGKTILLYGEQGLGDWIQFCRYAPLISAMGAKVVLEAPASLIELAKSLEAVDELVLAGSAVPGFDYHCPLLTLPLAVKTDLETIPNSPAYLRSDFERVSKWTDRLGSKSRTRIGVVWSGNVTHGNDQNRSIPIGSLLPCLPGGFEYVSLQKETRESDRIALEGNSSLRRFDEAIEDFSDTAALCELMDVVISVDTSVAHLSAALGKETWVLLPFAPDWRWMLGRDKSPWYPTVLLFRQTRPGDWSDVFERVATELAARQ